MVILIADILFWGRPPYVARIYALVIPARMRCLVIGRNWLPMRVLTNDAIYPAMPAGDLDASVVARLIACERPIDAILNFGGKYRFEKCLGSAVWGFFHGSEPQNGLDDREELKKPERSADDAQHPGSYRAGGLRGLETRGQEFDVCNNTAPVEGPVVTTTCPHTKRLVGGAVSGDCCSPALRIDLRAVPRRAWLGGANVPVSPSSRLHCNDNVRHAGDLGPRGSFTNHSIGTSTFR